MAGRAEYYTTSWALRFQVTEFSLNLSASRPPFTLSVYQIKRPRFILSAAPCNPCIITASSARILYAGPPPDLCCCMLFEGFHINVSPYRNIDIHKVKSQVFFVIMLTLRLVKLKNKFSQQHGGMTKLSSGQSAGISCDVQSAIYVFHSRNDGLEDTVKTAV